MDLFQPTDALVRSPFWVIAVASFNDHVTFSRSTFRSRDVDARAATVKVLPDATSVQISNSRASHITNLMAQLPPTDNFLTTVYPGDWVGAWIVDGEEQYRTLQLRIKEGKDVSAPEYGLKFLGKVQQVLSNLNVTATGAIQTTYNLTAAGFSELDSGLYYNSAVKEENSIPFMLQFLGISLDNLTRTGRFDEGNTVSGTIDSTMMIQALLAVIFGLKGPFAQQQGFPNSELRQSYNQPYVVPNEVLGWLGVTGVGYDAVLNLIIGRQHYDRSRKGYDQFMPSNIRGGTPIYGNAFVCDRLEAQYQVNVPQLNSIPVWGLLSNYLNHPINDMHVALKPITKDGKTRIRPTLVVRQNAFSTDLVTPGFAPMAKDTTPFVFKATDLSKPQPATITPAISSLPVTHFSELPRWVMPPSALYRASFGRMNTARVNYVAVLGSGNQVPDQAAALAMSPPRMDRLDIQRHGLRPYMTSTNCLLIDNGIQTLQQWRDMMADIVVGEHHTLAGTLTSAGVYEPVSPGDNLEFQNVVYHIESVTHACMISATGQKSFTTTFALSHGMAVTRDTTQPAETGIYAKVADATNVTKE